MSKNAIHIPHKIPSWFFPEDCVTENIKTEKKKFGIGNIVISDLLIIISLAFYIYSIIFTNYQNNELYLLIGGLIILSMIMFFCISIISSKPRKKGIHP